VALKSQLYAVKSVKVNNNFFDIFFTNFQRNLYSIFTKIYSPESGNTKGGSIVVPLTSSLTGLDLSVSHIKFSCLIPNQSNRRLMVQ
jgi:hypothetical protein